MRERLRRLPGSGRRIIAFASALLLLTMTRCVVQGQDNPGDGASDGDDLAADTQHQDDGGSGDADEPEGELPLLTMLQQFPTGSNCLGGGHGLEWIDGRLWVGCGTRILEMDPGSGTILATHFGPSDPFYEESCEGMAFDSTLWCVGPSYDNLVRFATHPPTSSDWDSWYSLCSNASALAWDGTNLWTGCVDMIHWESYIFVYDIGTETTELARYSQNQLDGTNYGAVGLAWDSVRDQLWSCGNNSGGIGWSVIRHAADATLSWEAYHQVDLSPDGLAFDGTNLWVGFHDPSDAQGYVRQYRINR